MFETTLELLKQMAEAEGGYRALLGMSALDLPFPLVLGVALLFIILLNISSLPNPYFSVLLGFWCGPLMVVVLTELWRLSPAAEPVLFHQPWWLTALVPAVLGPKIFDWGREGSPLLTFFIVGGIVAVFGSLAMIASRYHL
jgi:hypothetical protein